MPSISKKNHTKLSQLAKENFETGIRKKFNQSSTRATDFSYDCGGFYLDLSKTHISDDLIRAYIDYAEEIDFVGQRHSFLAGEKINISENRSVLHTLLRDATNQNIPMSNGASIEQAANSKKQFKDQYHRIKKKLNSRKIPVRDIIHVGIGGSSLGTQLIFEALKEIDATINIHFIGNIDGHQLTDVFSKCSAASTLVIGVSKTFSTAETLQNLDTIDSWFQDNGIKSPLENFYAVTANTEKAINYGIKEENTVSFPQWVGGRYSVWSAVSLSASIVIGWDKFEKFLEGAADVDQHFYTQELDSNVCFLAAMMDHFYSNYMDVKSRAIFAYDYRLRSFIGYLQQLETESNGKDRQRNGDPCYQNTSPVVWGGIGTEVQHSVFQMLHQGTSLIPSEFIIIKSPGHDLVDHHRELLANALAQPAALLAGQDYEEVNRIYANEKLSEVTKNAKIFSGNRPSSTILLKKLTAYNLGALLAFYEHRAYCFGIFTNINSFDQMGVELGKRLAEQVKPLLVEEKELENETYTDNLDQSTLSLLKQILS